MKQRQIFVSGLKKDDRTRCNVDGCDNIAAKELRITGTTTIIAVRLCPTHARELRDAMEDAVW